MNIITRSPVFKCLLAHPCSIRSYRQLYRPKIQMNFTSKDGRYHLYHSESGENYLKWLTRTNVFFLGGNSVLLALELLNPCKSIFECHIR